ncbi:asparagine--tRNA ligase, mitochondrial isoform X2 [Halictus rubicundus]|uniref:asparagine--tRNA ligase, mitochondrial isoform X2 n=1 Tax=Halictus rubicundus TaxID=77578 RepID=UPI004036E1E8
MFPKYIGRFLFRNLNSSKCNVRSMSQISNVHSKEALGKQMKVQGWVRAVRKMKDNIFVDVSDGLSPNMLQIVIPKSNKPEKLSYGCSIAVEGELGLAPNVKPHSTHTLKSMKREGMTEEESYFNTKTFLTVSGQLHLEVVARALTKVYTFGPTFRAENSKSRLHLSEFYMLEAEIAFVDSLDDIMDEVESLIKYVAKDVVEKGASDMNAIGSQEPEWLNQKFTRITYNDAIKILENNNKTLKIPVYGEAFTKEQELFLVEQNNNIPIFVTNWPKEIKPFYMKECKDDTSKVAAMDLLVPLVGELVGGSLREDDYEKLQSKLPSTSNLSWYLELRKHGNVPTGGYGLGFERLLQCYLGISNIKDTIPFPRWPHNCNL